MIYDYLNNNEYFGKKLYIHTRLPKIFKFKLVIKSTF